MDTSGGASALGVVDAPFKREISARLFEKIDLSKYALTPAEVPLHFFPLKCFLSELLVKENLSLFNSLHFDTD